MGETIYRYIGFPAFVDMIQRQSLHFVLPSVWEDPEETSFVYQWLSKLDKSVHQLMALLCVNRTYAQSWTSLEESDAMWRIYSYSNQAIRISVDSSKIKSIEGVKVIPVKYSDNLISYSSSGLSYSEILQQYISQKRRAFEHEKEVRLLYFDKIDEDKIEPAIRNIYYIIMGLKGKEIDINKIDLEEIKEYIGYSNINQKKKSHQVLFGHIPGFIKSVIVHPLASGWYVDTVKTYCKLNNVPFEGKSNLYNR